MTCETGYRKQACAVGRLIFAESIFRRTRFQHCFSVGWRFALVQTALNGSFEAI